MKQLAIVALVVMASGAATAEDSLAPIRDRLQQDFAARSADFTAYQTLVARDCRGFPEGDLFPFVFPVLAYTQLATAGTLPREQAIELMTPYCVQLVGPLAAKLRPGDGDLARVRDYASQATYLGQIALALGAWRLAGGDDRHDAARRALCDALHAGLVESDGAMLRSFPAYAWTFDTIPCLVALRLDDVANGTTRSTAMIRRHLHWIAAHLDPATSLPLSALAERDLEAKPPRGCELTLRIALLAQLDRRVARTLYDATVAALWRERPRMRGFAEYPEGVRGVADVDSGPIIDGVGLAATGFGVAAALANDDAARVATLARQLVDLAALRRQFGPAIQAMAGQSLGGVKLDEDYVTGFVFGDACLFYSTTWSRWPTVALPAD